MVLALIVIMYVIKLCCCTCRPGTTVDALSKLHTSFKKSGSTTAGRATSCDSVNATCRNDISDVHFTQY